MGVPAHLSFILPKIFFFAFEWSGCFFGSHLCQRDACSLPCLCRRHRFRSPGEGCPCLCTTARTSVRTVFSGDCRKSRTSGSCCCQGLSSLCRQACLEPAWACACRLRPDRLKTMHALTTKGWRSLFLFCLSHCCALFLHVCRHDSAGSPWSSRKLSYS